VRLPGSEKPESCVAVAQRFGAVPALYGDKHSGDLSGGGILASAAGNNLRDRGPPFPFEVLTNDRRFSVSSHTTAQRRLKCSSKLPQWRKAFNAREHRGRGDLGSEREAGVDAGSVRALSLAQELREELGNKGPVFRQPWPAFDPELAKEDEAEVVVQVNGKLRSRIFAAFGTGKEELEARAIADEKVQPYLAGKTIVKRITVPDKLVNLVVK
jgi:hypothetical protein